MDVIKLNCLVEGDDPYDDCFEVKINKKETVSALKKVIKDDKKPDFDNLSAGKLKLWKVDVSLLGSEKLDILVNKEYAVIEQKLEGTKLLAPNEVQDYFNEQPTKKYIHTIVERIISFVETEAAPENHDQPLAETIRQHIDYPSPSIDCNSFFTRDAYERNSFYSFHRTLDDLVMDDQCSKDESNEIKQKIDVQVNDNLRFPTLKRMTDLISIKSLKPISLLSVKEDISEKQSKEIESQESVDVSEKQVKEIEIQDVSEKQSKEVETQESVDVSEKQSKEVESQGSVNVIGPFLLLLDQQRKQLEKANAIRNSNNSASVSPTFPVRPNDKGSFIVLSFLKCRLFKCSFPHITKDECEKAGYINYCFVFADTGKYDNRNCQYPHIFRDELEIQKSPVSSKHKAPPAPKKSAKKKKSNTPDDLLYIANNIIATEIKDLDDMSVLENKGSNTTPDFNTLLKEFNQ
ncbi:6216_t:CDS:2 [Dentiscutata erythropus]|uniref:6216_t:CDS:1 n=1 Tax=Dentiscutata erythropus TaxID=1348616 RepID=A0A9N9FJE9_9GLOM|nr:6216_t:CDS:2 [Dentiscutata erythropus]